MSDFIRINEPRVKKILKMLDTVKTSARSNKAEAELDALFQPVRAKLGVVDESQDSLGVPSMSRARLDLSIACSKADRATRACEKVASELEELVRKIPNQEGEVT